MSRNSINYPAWVRRSHSISDYKKGEYVYIHTGDPYIDSYLYIVVGTARSFGRHPLGTIHYKIRDGFLILKQVEENHD